jgi:PST family polysaccharide transporter
MFKGLSSLRQSPVVQKITANMFWLTLEKLVRLGTGLAVMIAFARLLGAEKFGILNFSLAFVAIFGTFATFGLNGIVTRELVRYPASKHEILGSALFINLVSAFVFYLVLVGTVFVVRPEDDLTRYMVAVIGLSLFFKSAQVINYWFESQVNSKKLVWSESFVIFIISCVKITMVWYQAPLLALAWVFAAEAALVAIIVTVVYRKSTVVAARWTMTLARVRNLLGQSWPLLISSVAWIVYTRIDQIMIGMMLTNSDLGIYSAATRLIEAANILPTIIVISIVPAITNLRESNNPLYNRKFQQIYNIVVGVTLVIAVSVVLLSTIIVSVIFGDQYAGSVMILNIQAWSVVLVAMAVTSGRYLINEGLQRITMYRHLSGVVINVILNYFLIQRYGINGAAMSTLLSLFLANFLFDALHPSTRICFSQKFRALTLQWVPAAFARVAGKS